MSPKGILIPSCDTTQERIQVLVILTISWRYWHSTNQSETCLLNQSRIVSFALMQRRMLKRTLLQTQTVKLEDTRKDAHKVSPFFASRVTNQYFECVE